MDYMGSALAALGFISGLEDEGQREQAEHDIYERLAGWLYGNPEEMTYQEAYDKGIINYIPKGRNPNDTGVFNTGSQYLGALGSISEQYFQTRNILGAQQKNEQTEMRNKFGETLGTSMAQSREASAKSGFASSGAIQTATEKQLRSVMGEYGLGRQSVYDVYQGKFLGAQQETEEKIGEAEAWRREMELAMVPLEHAFMPDWEGEGSFGRAARRTTYEAQYRREYMDYLDQGGDKGWEDWYKTTYPQYWSEERGGTGGGTEEDGGDGGEDGDGDGGGDAGGDGDGEQPPPPLDGGEEPPVTELGGYTGYRNNGGTMSYADWLAAGKPERDEGGEQPPVPLPPPPPPPVGGEEPPFLPDTGNETDTLPPPPTGGELPEEPNTTAEAQAAWHRYVNDGGNLSFIDWIRAGQPSSGRPGAPGSSGTERPEVVGWPQGPNVPEAPPVFQPFVDRLTGSTGADTGTARPGVGLPSQTAFPNPTLGASLGLGSQVNFPNPAPDLANQKQGYQETTGTALGFQPQRVDFANPVLDTLQQKQKELDTFTNELTRMTKKKVGQTIKMPTVGNYYFNKRL